MRSQLSLSTLQLIIRTTLCNGVYCEQRHMIISSTFRCVQSLGEWLRSENPLPTCLLKVLWYDGWFFAEGRHNEEKGRQWSFKWHSLWSMGRVHCRTTFCVSKWLSLRLRFLSKHLTFDRWDHRFFSLDANATDQSDSFVMRQFTDASYTGTKIAYDPQEFEDKVRHAI